MQGYSVTHLYISALERRSKNLLWYTAMDFYCNPVSESTGTCSPHWWREQSGDHVCQPLSKPIDSAFHDLPWAAGSWAPLLGCGDDVCVQTATHTSHQNFIYCLLLLSSQSLTTWHFGVETIFSAENSVGRSHTLTDGIDSFLLSLTPVIVENLHLQFLALAAQQQETSRRIRTQLHKTSQEFKLCSAARGPSEG